MKTRIYIDFDGVIQETWSVIFQNYCFKYNATIINDVDLRQSMLDMGWNNILEKSEEINNAYNKIYHLMDKYEIFILTKINSKEEQEAKKIFLNEKKISNIIFVPYDARKNDFVNSHNCVLIDDEIYNLEEWEQSGGIAILFNRYMKNIDSYGNSSDKFVIIDDLMKICDIIENS